jgi:hypothetical protein
MICAALAAVSVSAFAQSDMTVTGTTTSEYINSHPWCPGNTEVAGKPTWELRHRVEKQANLCLSGGDRFELAYMLDRNPFEVNAALLEGLCRAQHQAVKITERMLAQRFPDDTSYASLPDNYVLQTTPVNSWDGEGRALRVVMTNRIRPKDISYDDALDILCMRLDAWETPILSDWWYSGASEADKDVIVRLLKDDASMADQTFYPSVYIHQSYSWINDKPPF